MLTKKFWTFLFLDIVVAGNKNYRNFPISIETSVLSRSIDCFQSCIVASNEYRNRSLRIKHSEKFALILQYCENFQCMMPVSQPSTGQNNLQLVCNADVIQPRLLKFAKQRPYPCSGPSTNYRKCVSNFFSSLIGKSTMTF